MLYTSWKFNQRRAEVVETEGSGLGGNRLMLEREGDATRVTFAKRAHEER